MIEENFERQKQRTLDLVKTAYKAARVWKQRVYELGTWSDYAQGWNDCLAEQKKNENKFIKYIENL